MENVNLRRGKKAFIHKANKSANRNFDAHKLDYIQKNLNLPSIREATIHHELFSTPNKIRIPDLTIQPLKKSDPLIIVEHDTVKIHGELADPNERTIKRNQDYIRTGKSFVIVNEDLADMLHLDEANLARYLIEHEKCKYKAIMGASNCFHQD